jgi:hypothetical protein
MKQMMPILSSIVSTKTANPCFISIHRLHPTAFTRNRRLSFQKVVFMKLDTVKQSNNDAVYNIMRDVFDEQPVKRQSFEEARDKISHTAFMELFHDSANAFFDMPDAKLYKGYRIFAIDGSTSALPKSEELKKSFGASTPVEGTVYCRISICADVLNESIMEGEIAGYEVGERILAQKHIEKISCKNALYLFDRGYWSKELIGNICNAGKKFLIRVQSNHAPIGCISGNFMLDNKHSLRYHKFTLKNGKTEHLVTNIGMDEMTNQELEKLYSLRWGVETRFNELKNQLGFMRFSGKSKLVVMQDFYAFLTVMNFIACAIHDADEIACEKRKDKELKHEYKIDKSSAINILKVRFLRAVIESNPRKKRMMFRQLTEDIAERVVPIRPGRHFKRRVYTGKHKTMP